MPGQAGGAHGTSVGRGRTQLGRCRYTNLRVPGHSPVQDEPVDPLKPDDLLAVAASCAGTLRSFVGEDWDARAGALEWTCRQTLEHICALGYAPILATRGNTVWPLALTVRPHSSVG